MSSPERWYARENDLIGGWSILNVDKSPSACDWAQNEIEIGCFLREADAKEIAESHNALVDNG
jgi:hypothetical protein